MNRVFVLSSTKKPLMPCSPARARRLLQAGKAAVYRMYPFTIILKYRADGDVQPIEFKLDPGSKTSGMVLVGDFPKKGRVVIWSANLEHRGQSIKKRLSDRAAIRRGRRGRKTWYRPARWLNRVRVPAPGFEKWFAPSLKSRVDNFKVWYDRLLDRAPITSTAVETVRFDTQKLENPEIDGAEYQQGTLFGYEVREYLLEKWGRKCMYCGAENVELEIEHIHPKSLGGSDRVSNLGLACRPCNLEKDDQPIEVFLSNNPDLLKKIKAQMKTSLKDAAAINSIRWAIGRVIQSYGIPTSFWSGGRTKKNRIAIGYVKDHWIDAACVGETGENVVIPTGMNPLLIKATGRGNRKTVRVNKYGFPCAAPARIKSVSGIRTGDIVYINQPKGKYIGRYRARVSAIKIASKFLSIQIDGKQTWFHSKLARILQRGDGYAYSNGCVSTAATSR